MCSWRTAVTNLIEPLIEGKAWVYIGLNDAEERYQEGLSSNKAIVSQSYYNSVYNAYLALGKEALSNYIATTDNLEVPMVDLEECTLGDSKSRLTSR
jgi:hypothetical protein